MPDRIIKESIRQSQTLDKLKPFEEVCFYRLLVTVDDYGRFYRDPQILKSVLFPRKADLTVKSIDDAFVSIERESLIKSYWVSGEQFLQITTWEKHQRRRAVKSKFPDENGVYTRKNDNPLTIVSNLPSNDSHCQQVADNGQQMSPNSNANSKTKTKANSAHAQYESLRYAPFADDDDLIAINKDHNEIFDLANDIGLPSTEYNRKQLCDLYNAYGKEPVLYGLREAARLNKVSIAYIDSVCKGYENPKPIATSPDRESNETDALYLKTEKMLEELLGEG